MKRIFLLLSIAFLSCQYQEKFDKAKWQDWGGDLSSPPPARKAMLKDLQANYKLEGMSRAQVIGLLGNPDFKEDSSISYKIEEDYGWDIDPIYSKDLEFTLRNGEKVTSVSVREWKK